MIDSNLAKKCAKWYKKVLLFIIVAFTLQSQSHSNCDAFFRVGSLRLSSLVIHLSDFSVFSDSNDGGAFAPLVGTMEEMGTSKGRISMIIDKIVDNGVENADEIIAIARDFVENNRPEFLTEVLSRDFDLKPIEAHVLRSALTILSVRGTSLKKIGGKQSSTAIATANAALASTTASGTTTASTETTTNSKTPWKKIRVAKRDLNDEAGKYGIDKDSISAEMALQLAAFESFMVTVAVNSQDPPIRKVTADVYMRHCRLFLGWWQREANQGNQISNLQQIFTSKEKSSAEPIFHFIQWLRTSRKISSSYEANVLRGLTKLAKFRFARESLANPSYGEKSYEDIPMIKELRKLHTFAGRQSKLSPRASDESKKWISWTEFLDVVKASKVTLDKQILSLQQEEYSSLGLNATHNNLTKKKKAVAELFQKFLLLSFLSNVPDRQRTFRELEIDKTFFFDSSTSPPCYVIRHSMQDYKTGKAYGERPPLVIAHELTPLIDEFIQKWRPLLQPKTQKFFVQSRTGNPLTQDSVYQIVSRTIFNYCGKKCNPHLLRDSIVTHVRDTDASEKELEALAIYMGHSINMQRNSYDRRTLKQKVSPAVNLLRSLSSSTSTSTSSSI